jgi:hypothetical protein
MLLNIIINIIWGYIQSHWTFYVAAVFLILGVSGGILDKYLKNSIKVSNSKKEILSDRNGEKGEDLLIADIQRYKSNDVK